MMCRALIALLSVAVAAQELPKARLVDAAFFGETQSATVPGPPDWRIAVDGQGNRFTMQTVAEPGVVGYVRKIAPDNSVVWVSRMEGQRLTGIALTPAGDLWVASIDASNNGAILHLDASGRVVKTVPIDGVPVGLAVDLQGSLYVAGTANSKFRATAGSWKREIGALRCSDRYGITYFACPEGFAMKFSPDAERVVYASFIGGTQAESIGAIAAGTDGSAYIVGETTSDDFPVTVGAAQPRIGGVATLGPLQFGDGFVVRLSPDGSHAIYSTYLGGPAGDRLISVAVDDDAGAVVVGRTDEPLVMPGSTADALLARFDRTGALMKQTKVGSPDVLESGVCVAISGGRVFVSLQGDGVKEFDPATLAPVRRIVPRVAGAAAIAVAAPAIVHVLLQGGVARTNIFAVAPGKLTLGSQYVARYDFDRPAASAVNALVNAASFVQGRRSNSASIAVAPGELITIFGEQFQQPIRVTLGGRVLAISYADDKQINAAVSEDVPPGTTQVSVETSDAVLGPWDVEVAPVVPGLFTVPCNSRSSCRVAAAINEDGTVNSMEHPARRGSVVALFGTGFGALTTDQPLRRLREHLQAYGPGGSGGGMEILYAGEAPGLPGVQQVNVRIGEGPDSAVAWSTYIRLVFDSVASGSEMTQDSVTIFVR